MIANSTCRRLFSVAILGLLISAAASAQDVNIKRDADADKFNEPEQLKATPDHKVNISYSYGRGLDFRKSYKPVDPADSALNRILGKDKFQAPPVVDLKNIGVIQSKTMDHMPVLKPDMSQFYMPVKKLPNNSKMLIKKPVNDTVRPTDDLKP